MIFKNIIKWLHKIISVDISMVHLPINMTPQLQYKIYNESINKQTSLNFFYGYTDQSSPGMVTIYIIYLDFTTT